MIIRSLSRYALLGGVSVMGMASAAMAENTGVPQPPASSDVVLTEIIVTAQRRSENLSRTPVAVAVVTADALAKDRVVSEQDLRVATPGLSVRTSANSNQLNFAIRGQSQDAFSSTAPGVMPYMNEIQLGGQGKPTDFFDLQSVQVLKGPQGTLFGRSATGGAVLFTTAKPTDKVGGYASVSGGNYRAGRIEGAINLPLVSDVLLSRLAGVYDRRDGFQYNLYDGQHTGDYKRYGVRASLTFKPGETLTNDLMVNYYRTDGGSTLGVIAGLQPFLGPGSPPYVPLEFLYGGTATPMATIGGQCTLQAFARIPGACPPVNPMVAGYYNAYFSDPHHPASGLRGALADQQARGPFVVNSGANNVFDSKNWIVSNSTVMQLNDHTSLKNILGFTHFTSQVATDADGTPYDIASGGAAGSADRVRYATNQFSEELQLLGKGYHDSLDYVLGAYYSSDATTNLQASSNFDIVFGGVRTEFDSRFINTTYAAYAQGTQQLNDRGLAFTLGARYTSEEVGRQTLSTDISRIGLGEPAPNGYSYSLSDTYNRLSWQIGLQDQINPDLLVYLVARRAYKSGGFNGQLAPAIGLAATGGAAFGAERLTDAELGLKFSGAVAAMPTRVNVALFHNWISDSQRTSYALLNGSPGSFTVNVPSGKTYGFEVDGQIKPVDPLTIGVVYNYTHARYDRGDVIANGASFLIDQVPDTAENSGSVYADVTIPLSYRLNFDVRGEVFAQSATNTSPSSSNRNGTNIAAYDIVNMRAGVSDKQARWSVTANVKNVLDKVYYVGGIPLGDALQINTQIPGEPRTYTLTLRMDF